MANDIMVDIESLDTSPNCVILTIGAVRFDPKGSGVVEKLELRPTIEDQTEIHHRSIMKTHYDGGLLRALRHLKKHWETGGARHLQNAWRPFISFVGIVVLFGVTVLVLTVLLWSQHGDKQAINQILYPGLSGQ